MLLKSIIHFRIGSNRLKFALNKDNLWKVIGTNYFRKNFLENVWVKSYLKLLVQFQWDVWNKISDTKHQVCICMISKGYRSHIYRPPQTNREKISWYPTSHIIIHIYINITKLWWRKKFVHASFWRAKIYCFFYSSYDSVFFLVKFSFKKKLYLEDNTFLQYLCDMNLEELSDDEKQDVFVLIREIKITVLISNILEY